MSRTVIIDGDIIVYRASDAALEVFETELEEDETFVYRITSYANKKVAIEAIQSMIDKICEATKSDKVVICLSDGENFRKQINPNYKGNRKKKLKPELYQFLRHWFENESGYEVYALPDLEADDVAGILATSDKIQGDKCVWSFDKDFKTIPCKFAKGSPDGKITKKLIIEKEADWWFMYQTLIGDTTDGYTGCKGIGDKKARKILGAIGEKSLEEMWKLVVETYKEAGYSEDEALLNARMARILRAEDYAEGRVKLWNINASMN